MSLTKSEVIEKNRYELQFSVDKATFDAAVNAVYRKQVKNISVPGFRKGKAPRSIIEKMYGTGVFYEDAINDLIPDAYTEALKEAAIDAVGQPEFDVVSIDENGLVLSAKVYVKPEVEIKDYLGIEVEKEVVAVTDEDVDREIETIRERNSREIDVTDRPAEMGDTTVIDFEGFCDGVAFEGGKGTDYALKLGSGSFIPGFEEGLIGVVPNTTSKEAPFDLHVSFPEDYSNSPDLAGKAVVFKVWIEYVVQYTIPTLTDDYVKNTLKFDGTAEEYKAHVKDTMQAEATASAESEALNAIMSLLTTKSEFKKLPEE